MGIWVIVCIQKPSHHFLQTFCPLRMFKIALCDSWLYPNTIVCYGRSAHEYDVILWRHKQRTPSTNDIIRNWLEDFEVYFKYTTISTFAKTTHTNARLWPKAKPLDENIYIQLCCLKPTKVQQPETPSISGTLFCIVISPTTLICY